MADRINFNGENGELSLEAAIARFKRGQCPSCGKGLGEPRGLEYRPRFEDVYCHTCKRPWPSQMDVAYLEGQVAAILTPTVGARPAGVALTPLEAPGAVLESPSPEPGPALSRVVSGFYSLLGGVLRRR